MVSGDLGHRVLEGAVLAPAREMDTAARGRNVEAGARLFAQQLGKHGRLTLVDILGCRQ
jgi:hypothetical protein